MITAFDNVPPDTDRILFEIDAQPFEVIVQSDVPETAGAHVLFTLNKNNPLSWIGEWAQWHVCHHRTDTIFLFDNGSDAYPLSEVESTLSAIGGLKRFAVISLTHKYGPVDKAVRLDPYWPRFLQVGAMSIVLRRLAPQARALLNCDIDELANPPGDIPLYEVAEQSRSGLVILEGKWVAPIPENGAKPPFRHRDFRKLDARGTRPHSPVKWVLDPRRHWISNLNVHPYMHWIARRPFFSKTIVEDGVYWHFRGINTGWKDTSRTNTGQDGPFSHDSRLDELFARLTQTASPR